MIEKLTQPTCPAEETEQSPQRPSPLNALFGFLAELQFLGVRVRTIEAANQAVAAASGQRLLATRTPVFGWMGHVVARNLQIPGEVDDAQNDAFGNACFGKGPMV